MVDLSTFTSTTKDEFAQLARDRKRDFDLLRSQGQWTTSVYIAGYIVEARLKYKICERLDVDNLPAIFKTHDLLTLIIYTGLSKSVAGLQEIYKNLSSINAIHHKATWRYKTADAQDKVHSDDLDEWLFHPQYGVITWLGL